MVLLTNLSNRQKAEAVPERFQTARATLLFDRFMSHFIRLGGISVIIAVCAIFVFITVQTLPLFSGAKVKELETFQLPQGNYQALGADEWGEIPFLINSDGAISFVRLAGNGEVETVDPMNQIGEESVGNISTFRYLSRLQKVIYGTDQGIIFLLGIVYEPVFQGDQRKIQYNIEKEFLFPLANADNKIIDIAFGDGGNKKLVAAILETSSGERTVEIIWLKQKQTLLGSGETRVDKKINLSHLIKERPKRILVNSQADGIVLSTQDHQIIYIAYADDAFEVRQIFKPFEGYDRQEIASMSYLFGEVSLILTNPDGVNVMHSLFIPKGETQRFFGQTKSFESLPGGALFYDASLRNKAFLIGRENFASLRYGTTEAIRWQKELSFDIKLAKLGRKYDKIFFLDQENQLRFYELQDPHPEAGLKAYFGKIWYEGYTQPGFEWQSTGATDDFEPKLSLIPLIIGTLKGTLYAMLFAFPIALLAALYTSQFAHPRFRLLIKPAMEIMASLPSVVLGFLAALWLAPLIETRVPSLLLVTILLPLGSFAFGWFWSSLSIQYRKWLKPGYEWIAIIPLMGFLIYAGWHLGPALERLFFVTTDPVTGARIADFRYWWPQVTGTPFEQRNSLVVGFMMGFAVIPIIFTIAEDSLSNVPRVLVSGSLALGASRWQTALNIVLPTASPGVFSAIMIGLGRAVGETMIVVMATGNTPILNWNIFSGMRTLSANIAVELPEAPYLGTLYRTLFLGAVVLFLMTFCVNTVAEIIRQHFREKYKTV